MSWRELQGSSLQPLEEKQAEMNVSRERGLIEGEGREKRERDERPRTFPLSSAPRLLTSELTSPERPGAIV